MTFPQPTVDTTYRNFAELLLRCHRLQVEGKEDDPEIEEVEDELCALWERLNDVQRQSLNGAGSDLNWVRRRGSPPPRGRRPADVTQEDRQHLADAEATRDWHAVLYHLRLCAPVLDVNDLARRRAAAYAGVGFPDYERACREMVAGTEL